MKRKYGVICLSIIAAAAVLIAGMGFGGWFVTEAYAAEEKDSIRIAVVNQDMGVDYLGETVNYAVNVLNIMDDSFEIVGNSAAQAGLENGAYDAIVTFPADFSRNIISINDPEPIQARMEYTINDALDDRTKLNISLALNELESNINNNMEYVYIRSIFDELHGAQGNAQEVLGNDAEDLSALEELKNTDLNLYLEITAYLPENYTPGEIDLVSFQNEMDQTISEITSQYEAGVASQEEEYTGLKENASAAISGDQGIGEVGATLDGLANNSLDADVAQLKENTISEYNDEIERLKQFATYAQGGNPDPGIVGFPDIDTFKTPIDIDGTGIPQDKNFLDLYVMLEESFTDTTTSPKIELDEAITGLQAKLTKIETEINSHACVIIPQVKDDLKDQFENSNGTENLIVPVDGAGNSDIDLLADQITDLLNDPSFVFDANAASQLNTIAANLHTASTTMEADDTNKNAALQTIYNALPDAGEPGWPNDILTELGGIRDGLDTISGQYADLKTNLGYINTWYSELDSAQKLQKTALRNQIDAVKTDGAAVIDVPFQAFTDGITAHNQAIQDSRTLYGNHYSQLTDVEKQFTEFDPMAGINGNLSQINSLTGQLSATAGGLSADIGERLSKDMEYVTTSSMEANTFVQEVQTKASETTKGLQDTAAGAVQEYYSSRSTTSQDNVNQLNSFIGRMPNSKLGTVENTSLYNFMAAPVEADYTWDYHALETDGHTEVPVKVIFTIILLFALAVVAIFIVQGITSKKQNLR